MKILKILGGIIGVALIAFGAFLMLAPGEASMERSIEIDAPREVVFQHVNNLQQWEKWSPWYGMDPSMQVTYSETKEGNGASYSWTGDETGKGTLTILESTAPESIQTDLDFGQDGRASGNWKFEEVEGGGTKATWAFHTKVSGMGKMVHLFMSTLEAQYDEGLAKLKEVAEEAAKAAPPAPPVEEASADSTAEEAATVEEGSEEPAGDEETASEEVSE